MEGNDGNNYTRTFSSSPPPQLFWVFLSGLLFSFPSLFPFFLFLASILFSSSVPPTFSSSSSCFHHLLLLSSSPSFLIFPSLFSSLSSSSA